MKEGWENKKLPEISENLDSLRKPVTKKNRTAGIYPYYGASGIVDYVDDYLFDEDLLCISEDGANLLMRTYPIAFPISGKVWVNNHAHVLRFKNVATQKYVEYFFAGLKLDKYITGAAQPKLTQKALNNIIINIPTSIDEQQSIVDYLDSVFAKIDVMKVNAEKALNEAKALFQKTLEEVMKPKEEWGLFKLKEICTHIVDCPHSTPKKSTSITNYPCIRTSELRGGEIEWSSMQYLDEDEYQKRISRLAPIAEDIVYGREGTYGDAVLLPEGYHFSLGQRTMLLRANKKFVTPKFLLMMMISTHVYNQAKAKNSGCGVGHVNVGDIKLFNIYLPPLSEQQSIVTTLDSLKSKVDRLQENYGKISQECDALKQAILRQVFE